MGICKGDWEPNQGKKPSQLEDSCREIIIGFIGIFVILISYLIFTSIS